MKLFILFVYMFTINVVSVCAKISGGPRGRFDKQNPRRNVTTHTHHVSARHTHYSYHPPSHINFMCRHCTSMTSYPVYHGLLPSYVYKYRETGTRFGYLLTGLALYNLGRATVSSHNPHYTQRPDEKCCMQVIDRTHFEETPFPCFMMSSFLEQTREQGANTFDITSSQINVKSYLHFTDSSFEVNREQECVIWLNSTTTKTRKSLPCALLKEYADTMKPSGVPVYVWLPIILMIVITISVSCQCCCKKKKYYKEEEPLNQHLAAEYSPNYDC